MTDRNPPLVIFNPRRNPEPDRVSETQAWQYIAAIAGVLRKIVSADAVKHGLPYVQQLVRQEAQKLDRISVVMKQQVADGVHKNPSAGHKLATNVQAICYVHAQDGKCYVHGFGNHDPSQEELDSGMLDMGALKTRTGVEMFFNPAHTELTIRHKDGKKLIGLFPD